METRRGPPLLHPLSGGGCVFLRAGVVNLNTYKHGQSEEMLCITPTGLVDSTT